MILVGETTVIQTVPFFLNDFLKSRTGSIGVVRLAAVTGAEESLVVRAGSTVNILL